MSVKSDIVKYGHAKNWYYTGHKMICSLFGDDANLFADIFASISPRTALATNWRLAVEVYVAVKSGKEIDWSSFWRCHKGNILQAIARKPLSGPKVQAFAENLRGNYERVTIDRWILRYFHWTKKRFPTVKQYGILEKRIRKLAERYGLKPAELQAILWTAVRDRAGELPSDFLTASGELPF